MTASLIERLLGSPLERFRAEHWPARPLHFAGPLDRLAELAARPELASIPALIAAHQGRAWLHLQTPAGAYDHETSVDPAEAAELYERGTMMDLRDLQRWLPPVRTWLERLSEELGLEPAVVRSGYCHAFVSPAGTGAPKHFDNREVFVVQLLGRKRWRVAPNHELPMPLMPHVVGGPVHAFNRHAQAELDAPEMPDDATPHVLAPGAALFIPRGYWHTTHALEDSLSLSFGFRIPSWAELFANTALQALAREPAWRATAYDVTRVRPPGAENFARGLARLLEELRAHPPPPEHPADDDSSTPE